MKLCNSSCSGGLKEKELLGGTGCVPTTLSIPSQSFTCPGVTLTSIAGAVVFGQGYLASLKIGKGRWVRVYIISYSEAGSEIPIWALSPINDLPKLEKINMLWQHTFPPASLGKGWRLACWKRATETNAGKGGGLHSEQFEMPFFESFLLSPPMFLPHPGEISGKCWSTKICLLVQALSPPQQIQSPTPALPNLPQGIKKQQQTAGSLQLAIFNCRPLSIPPFALLWNSCIETWRMRAAPRCCEEPEAQVCSHCLHSGAPALPRVP